MYPQQVSLFTLSVILGLATPALAKTLERASHPQQNQAVQVAVTQKPGTRGLTVIETGWNVDPSRRPGDKPSDTNVSATRHPESISVTEAWIRQPPPGSRMLAGYLSFRNDSVASIALTGATCDAFEEVQIHTIARDPASGMVRMVRLNELVIPARQTLVMAPGHDHLMLINPKRDLQPGEKLTLTLYFGKSLKQQVVAEVRGRAKPAS